MSKTIAEDIESLQKRVEELEQFPQGFSNDNGTAIKFADGTMICTQSRKDFQNSVEAYGTMYSTVERQLPNFPIPFTSVDAVVLSPTR